MTKRYVNRNQRLKRYLSQSNWVTDGWSWFMVLAGKAAEPVLILSVLYSSAKLLPAIQPYLTAQFDAVVFIAQFIALDVGGLSLNKMADQVQATNPRGAQLAKRLSIALVSIMIAGVILASLSSLMNEIPQVQSVIDTMLLIARAILAVLYSRVIHSLKGDDQTEQGAQPGVDSWALAGLSAYLLQATQHMINEQANQFRAELQAERANIQALIQKQFQAEQATIQATIPQLQGDVQAPEVNVQALVQAVSDYLIPQFQTRLQAMDQAMAMQHATIIEVATQLKQLPSHVASRRSEPARKSPLQAQPIVQPGIHLVPETASREALIAEAMRLQAEGMSTYKIAEALGKSAKTVQYWLSKSGTAQAEHGEVEGMM